MFGTQTSRSRKAERIAGQAWNNLVSAVDSAGSATRSATRSAKRRAATMVDDASDRMESGAHEARRRTNAALDALAGRKPRTPWGWLAAATLVGAAFGWVAQRIGRTIVGRPEPLPLPDSLADDATTMGAMNPPRTTGRTATTGTTGTGTTGTTGRTGTTGDGLIIDTPGTRPT
jgi:ElaB/YqjD/DUF883 family membrane-anchored ribosome-binding protein